ncbi:hypothetical protein GGR57DRAFT_438897 [Xylariaceae sp. FL1272]|nr:hypothetical protein GGR57DRAFT_438897 [Xylariaceae sp. FL1272]
MRGTTLLPIALAILPAVVAQGSFSCAPDCKSCGLYCNSGCTAPLDYTKCSECLYCRRESSSCGFVEISAGQTNPPDPAYCAACEEGCHCYIDAKCYDNVTITPPSSSAAVPVPTGMAPLLH